MFKRCTAASKPGDTVSGEAVLLGWLRLGLLRRLLPASTCCLPHSPPQTSSSSCAPLSRSRRCPRRRSSGPARRSSRSSTRATRCGARGRAGEEGGGADPRGAEERRGARPLQHSGAHPPPPSPPPPRHACVPPPPLQRVEAVVPAGQPAPVAPTTMEGVVGVSSGAAVSAAAPSLHCSPHPRALACLSACGAGRHVQAHLRQAGGHRQAQQARRPVRPQSGPRQRGAAGETRGAVHVRPPRSSCRCTTAPSFTPPPPPIHRPCRSSSTSGAAR